MSWHTWSSISTQLTKRNTDRIHGINVSNFAVNDSYTARYFRLHAVLQTAHYIYGLSPEQPASLTLSSWRQTSASINFPTYVDSYLKYPTPWRSSYHVLHDAREFGSHVAPRTCLLTHQISSLWFFFTFCWPRIFTYSCLVCRSICSCTPDS